MTNRMGKTKKTQPCCRRGICKVLTRPHYPLEAILLCTLVYRVLAESAQAQRDDARAGIRGRSLERAPLGDRPHTIVRKGVSPAEADCEQEPYDARVSRTVLQETSGTIPEAYSRVCQGPRPMEVLVSRSRQGMQRCRFPAARHRNKAAARRYFDKAVEQNGEPGTTTVDKSVANLAALEVLKRGGTRRSISGRPST
ncbi:hypothetical protein OKW34_002817 [Paraburkholderia youngii]